MSRRLARTLIVVGERIKGAFAEAMDQLDLPVPLARTLLALEEPEPMGDLACHLRCDPSHITGIADRLEERGLVRRVAGHDRRVKLLELTADGAAMRDRIIAVATASSPTARLDQAHRVELLSLLEQLVDEPIGASHQPS
ncbi:MarR family transcriptional regulator [Isoptericola sp. b441]|uniref:MarR family transcriptional regulator n=1 Tax=Actinotalea lenta TaxID=3064654 RepID=A0ABT9D8P7_9CELL|nr:MarR family transcriptional regulator [Isoptericola sp. b441]MDO8107265.1 MarR family transcriptional regulator [Isoptericola sp. b441]MDO8121072.1 MarR family transcriptional regulator [Isoptericola sp. b490]